MDLAKWRRLIQSDEESEFNLVLPSPQIVGLSAHQYSA